MTTETRARAALNRLAKWRALFAGWQLGTRPLGDPECDAVRDHREATLLLRAELSALVTLLVRNGVIDHQEWLDALADAADQLNSDLELRFPGVRATDLGLTLDARAADTMRGWKP